MRRLFIIRKDLNMSSGKLAAQVAHCAEAYWTNKIREGAEDLGDDRGYRCTVGVRSDVFKEYVNGRFVKTICEARNKAHLLEAQKLAEGMRLREGEDYGLIYDACLTELEPEEPDGTTLTGIWFRPLQDDAAHYISKRFQLYREGGHYADKRHEDRH